MLAVACAAYCTGCGQAEAPRAPRAGQGPPTPPPLAAENPVPVRPTSFPESPALQRLADAGAWITVRTTFLPAASKGTLVKFEDQEVSAGMMRDVTGIGGDVFLDIVGCRFKSSALKPLNAMENLHALALIGDAIDDDLLGDLSSLPNVEVFITTSPNVSARGLRLLQRAPRVHYLWLEHSSVSDIIVPRATDHTTLIELHVTTAPLTDAGLANIAELPALLHLDLSDCKIGDSGLGHLSALKELRTLDLEGTKVTDAGLQSLRGLEKLEWLNLDRTDVTGVRLDLLGALPNLRALSLSHTRTNDDGLSQLKGFRALRSLILRNTAVTNASVVKLSTLPSLDDLDVRGTSVTEEVRSAFSDDFVLFVGKKPPDEGSEANSSKPKRE